MVNKYEKLAIISLNMIKKNGKISEKDCINIASGDSGDGKRVYRMLKDHNCGKWVGYGDIKYSDDTDLAISQRLFENMIEKNNREIEGYNRKQMHDDVAHELNKAQLYDI